MIGYALNHAVLRFFAAMASLALRAVSYHRENSRVPCGEGTFAMPATMRACAGLTSFPTTKKIVCSSFMAASFHKNQC